MENRKMNELKVEKLSKVQREVLEYIVRGHGLFASINGGSWLDKVTTQDSGLYRRVHGNTLHALHKRGYIAHLDSARTPWWRRDYEITDAGREALDAFCLNRKE